MPPDNGKRTPLALSYSWGQPGPGVEAPFDGMFRASAAIFSPGGPVVPAEPEALRLWDFPVGVNTVYTPRASEPVSFAELRALAEAHDITRLAIETRKDQIERLEWRIKQRGTGRPDPTAPARAAALAAFWQRPDGTRPFASWLRELLEDVLVLDAPALEVRRNRAGELIALDVVDGATITPLFDETGRRPLPPAPAFEQVIHGRPWKLLTADELLYLPRNPRPHKAYGFGPVEQIVMTINIGLRRQAAQLQHFTEGNVPPGLVNAPDGWSVEQIRQFQEWFDSVLAGNTAARSRLVWGPSGATYQPFKEAPYKDDFDEWLARIVCYAFSLPPTAFTRQVNRATAETAQEAALTEGLAPLMGWVKRLADHVIQQLFGEDDLEFAWLDERPPVPAEQAKTLDLYVRAGVFTINEARAALGLDPVAGGDDARIYGTAGAAPLATAAAQGSRMVTVGAVAKAGFNPGQPRVPAGNADGGEWAGDGDGGAAATDGNSASGEDGPGSAQSEPAAATGGRAWERFPNAEFRDRLATAEQTADKTEFGYREINSESGALGRYQMRPEALRVAGMTDARGNWTGKYGIFSAAQFLASPDAQEMVLTDLLSETERQLRRNGAFDFIGTNIDGLRGQFIVTHAGLLAAGHRQGARATRNYLYSMRDAGFTSASANLTTQDLRVETRLRTFAETPSE